MLGGAPIGAPPDFVFLLRVLAGTFGEAWTGERALFYRADSGEGDRRMTRSNSALKRHSSHRNKTALFLTALFSGALCAHAVTTVVTNQPSLYAGWETAQDVPLPPRQAETRFFKAEITFTATASNNVQMAFGTDIDKDGRLPAEETSATIGWDRGAWFILSGNLLQKFMFVPQDASTVTSRTLKMSVRFSADGTPLSLTFKDGAGTPLVFDGLEGVPTWMSPKLWDTAALTARGWDARDEQATISFVLDGTQILLW